jgi:hypothetical protein
MMMNVCLYLLFDTASRTRFDINGHLWLQEKRVWLDEDEFQEEEEEEEEDIEFDNEAVFFHVSITKGKSADTLMCALTPLAAVELVDWMCSHYLLSAFPRRID